MFTKQNIFSVVVASSLVVTVAAANNPDFFTHKLNMNLMSLMSRSNDPQNTAKCFQFYNPMINKIIDTYEREFNACCEKAKVKRNEIDEETSYSRQVLANKTEDTCAALNECKQLKSVENQYQCYGVEGNENSKVLRGLSTDALSQLAVYQEQNRVVIFNEEVCQNKTRDIFEEDSNKVYDDLGYCLLGKSTVPTPEPSSSTTSTTTSTTTSS